MAQKPKKSPAKKAKVKPPHHENALERFGEEIEERFFEGAELATSTTSPETNVLLAVERAIVGPRTPKPKAEKRSDGKPEKVRPKKR
jgi:hypothetical protein